MPDGIGRPLYAPEGGAHKAHKAQDPHLRPDLNVDVVGVDEGGSGVVEVQQLHVALDGGGAQARAGEGAAGDNLQPRLEQGKAAVGGGVGGVENGEDAVPDAAREEGHRQKAQGEEEGQQLGLPEENHHHHGAGDADPGGAAVGHAQGGGAQDKGCGGRQLGNKMLGAQNQGQGERQKENQHLGKGVGVVEKGEDPAGHVGVQVHVHIGLVDLQAGEALENGVQGGDGHAAGGPRRQALELLRGAQGADGYQHAEGGGNVVNEEPGGGVPGQGEDHAQDHRPKEEGGEEADGLHVQPPVSPAHGPGVEQEQEKQEGYEGVGVVPVLVGDDPKEENQPALGHGGFIPQAEGQLGEEAGFKGPLQKQVELAEQTARQVHQAAEKLAGLAVRPGAGSGPLPAQGAENGAFLHLAAAPGPQPDGQAVQGAVLIGGQEQGQKMAEIAFF